MNTELYVTPYGVDFTYEAYYCDGSCYGCSSGEYYCSGAVYEGVELDADSISVERILSSIFDIPARDLPIDLIHYAIDELHMEDADEYEVDITGGPYGQEADVVFTDWVRIQEGLTRWLEDHLHTVETNPAEASQGRRR